VTDLATVTDEPLLDKVTTNPPVPALPFRLTVPFVGKPPAVIDGLTLTKASAAGVIVRVAVWD
jgi:hypothetical protein